jgi:hypothetical protein
MIIILVYLSIFFDLCLEKLPKKVFYASLYRSRHGLGHYENRVRFCSFQFQTHCFIWFSDFWLESRLCFCLLDVGVFICELGNLEFWCQVSDSVSPVNAYKLENIVIQIYYYSFLAWWMVLRLIIRLNMLKWQPFL